MPAAHQVARHDSSGTRALLAAARRGDRQARARLVEFKLPLIRTVAASYRDYGLPLDDLVQEGSIGFLEAIDRYDAGRECPFESYARFRIRRAIRNALTDQARPIRVPKHVVQRRRELDRAEARMLAAGVHPTPVELAAATGLSVSAVVEARASTQVWLSLDEPVHADGSTLGSIVADPAATDPAEMPLAEERASLLERALERLSQRQRSVLTAQWGLKGTDATTAAALARELGLSPRRTQTIGRDALDLLRREIEQAGACVSDSADAVPAGTCERL